VNACPFLKVPGLHIDGAYAEAMVVPADALVRIPERLVRPPPRSPRLRGVALPRSQCRATLMKGERVVVVGVGGLGTQAVALAKILGAARIVAVDRNPAALDRAVRAGADTGIEVVDGSDPCRRSRPPPAAASRSRSSASARPRRSRWDAQPRPRWSLAVWGVGMQPPPIELPQALFALWELSMVGSFGSHRDDLGRSSPWRPTTSSTSGRRCRTGVDVVAGVPEGLEQLRAHRDNLNASSWCPRPFAGTLV